MLLPPDDVIIGSGSPWRVGLTQEDALGLSCAPFQSIRAISPTGWFDPVRFVRTNARVRPDPLTRFDPLHVSVHESVHAIGQDVVYLSGDMQL